MYLLFVVIIKKIQKYHLYLFIQSSLGFCNYLLNINEIT